MPCTTMYYILHVLLVLSSEQHKNVVAIVEFRAKYFMALDILEAFIV